MNIFEQASRMALRFESTRGDLTVEQLWTLPLTSTSPNRVSLDTVGQAVMQKLANSAAVTFMETSSPTRSDDELRLEILKHIRDVKQAEAKAVRDLAAKRAEKERLLEILEQKRAGQMAELSIEELEARVAALG